MLFGSKETFAIEVTVFEHESLVAGAFAFWLGGRRLGDLERISWLRMCYLHSVRLLSNFDRCYDAHFSNLDAKSLLDLAMEPVAEDLDDMELQDAAANDFFYYACISFGEFDQVFDEYLLIVTTQHDTMRFAWSLKSDYDPSAGFKHVSEMRVARFDMLLAIRAFAEWYESLDDEGHLHPKPW